MDKKEQFINFLDSLKGHGQNALIETIERGFKVYFENYNNYEIIIESNKDKEKIITYKGKGITKTFPAGYYRWYSDKEKRFLVYDDLKMAKADIDKELEESEKE
jgi:hypothetical protein